jgi:hypothetical protein
MARYMMVYKGQATDMADMTPDEAEAVLGKWTAWMEKLGPALVDIGTPFGPGTSAVDDGSTGPASALSGYSIVEAADLAAAASLTTDHPYLSEGKGHFAIDVYELIQVPFEA